MSSKGGSQIVTHLIGILETIFVLFDTILQNMLLGETFQMVCLKCVSCNGCW